MSKGLYERKFKQDKSIVSPQTQACPWDSPWYSLIHGTRLLSAEISLNLLGMLDIRVKIRQDRLAKIYQRVVVGIVSTTKLNLPDDLLLEISAMISSETQLKIGKGTLSLIYIYGPKASAGSVCDT